MQGERKALLSEAAKSLSLGLFQFFGYFNVLTKRKIFKPLDFSIIR